MSEVHTFHFAPEIEQAIVSICWHEPERLGLVYRELDAAVHLTQPHLRHILEAISLGYRELGCVDFPIVTQVLRETRRLDDCGGLPGVNEVYNAQAYGREDSARNQAIFEHYMEMLKTYALHRTSQALESPYRFTGGSGTLFPNKVRRSPQSPDFEGPAAGAGKKYSVRLWSAPDGSFLNFKLYPQ